MSLDHEAAVADRGGSPQNSGEPAAVRFSSADSAPARRSDLVPYLVPMFAYVGLGTIESYLPSVQGQPSPFWYPLAYSLKALIVAILAWYFRATWSDFRPWPKRSSICAAVLLGLVVVALWVGLDGLYPVAPISAPASTLGL